MEMLGSMDGVDMFQMTERTTLRSGASGRVTLPRSAGFVRMMTRPLWRRCILVASKRQPRSLPFASRYWVKASAAWAVVSKRKCRWVETSTAET